MNAGGNVNPITRTTNHCSLIAYIPFLITIYFNIILHYLAVYSCNDYAYTINCSPEGSATSSFSAVANNPVNPQCPDRSGNIVADTPKPPPGYGDDLSSDQTESFSNRQTAATSPTSVVGKWPLKPGVLVHSKQQLLKPLSVTTTTVYQANGMATDDGGGHVKKTDSNDHDKLKSKKTNSVCKLKSPAESVMLTNETQSARAARIRRMMIGSNNNLPKKPAPMTPPPAPPIRQNQDNSPRNVGEKYASVTGSQTTKRDNKLNQT